MVENRSDICDILKETRIRQTNSIIQLQSQVTQLKIEVRLLADRVDDLRSELRTAEGALAAARSIGTHGRLTGNPVAGAVAQGFGQVDAEIRVARLSGELAEAENSLRTVEDELGSKEWGLRNTTQNLETTKQHLIDEGCP